MTIRRHTALGRTPLDEWSDRRRDLYLITYNTYKRQRSTPHPRAGFELAVPANERPKTHTLDRAVTGVSYIAPKWRKLHKCQVPSGYCLTVYYDQLISNFQLQTVAFKVNLTQVLCLNPPLCPLYCQLQILYLWFIFLFPSIMFWMALCLNPGHCSSADSISAFFFSVLTFKQPDCYYSILFHLSYTFVQLMSKANS